MLALTALAALWSQRGRCLAFFGAAWLLSILIAQLIYTVPYARYVHADHVALVIFLAGAVANAPFRMARLVTAVALAGWFYADLRILRDPRSAPLPAGEILQYVTGLWSGDGNTAALNFLAQQRPCVVFVHRYSRPGSYAAVLAARRDPALNIVPLSLESALAVSGAKAVATKARSLLGPKVRFLVLAEGAPPPERPFLEAAGVSCRVVWDHLKPDGASHLTVVECDL